MFTARPDRRQDDGLGLTRRSASAIVDAPAATRRAPARGGDRRTARREQDADPRGARPTRAGRARRDDVLQGRGRERSTRSGTSRRSTSCASSSKARPSARPRPRRDRRSSRPLREVVDAEPCSCATRGISPRWPDFSSSSTRSSTSRSTNERIRRVDREPPGSPHEDRQAHGGHPRARGGLGRGARRDRRGDRARATRTRRSG